MYGTLSSINTNLDNNILDKKIRGLSKTNFKPIRGKGGGGLIDTRARGLNERV